jgi:uncharacterized protein (TIGR02452 family)
MKEKRKQIAFDTLGIIDKGIYTLPNNDIYIIKKDQEYSKSNSIHYKSDELSDLLNNVDLTKTNNTVIEVTNESSIDAIIRLNQEGYSNTMCLNFASVNKPGGGFINGAQAQEESLARSSGLYDTLIPHKGFYTGSIKSVFYSDDMIYSPKVPFIKNDKGDLIPTILTSVITAAAVNLNKLISENIKTLYKEDQDHIKNTMDKRIDKLLSLCKHKNHEVIILGAWGCGVFKNDPNVIAELFNKHLNNKYKNVFKKVVFAIYKDVINKGKFKSKLNAGY